MAAKNIDVWPSTHRHASVKVSANNSTRFTRHQGSSNLVAADTIKIIFLRFASSEKNRLHRTVHASSRAAISFGEVNPRASHALRAAGFTCWHHNCHVSPSDVSYVRHHQSACWRHPLTFLFDGWLWLSLTVDFLQPRCSLLSFSRRFHFCSIFLHILLLNEE